MKILLASIIIGLSSGCTTTSSQTEHVKVAAEDRGVIRNNKQQPQWAVDQVKAKDGQNFYFVSIVEKSYKLNIGIEKAKTDALGNVAQMIGTDIAKAASTAASGDPSTAEGVQEAFESATAALSKTSVSGVTVDDVYWEEIKGATGEKSYFSVSVLVAVPKTEIARVSKIWLDKFNKKNNTKSIQDDVKRKVEDYSSSTEG